MALDSLAALDQFKTTPFAPGFPPELRAFNAPIDKVHEALTTLFQSVTHSLVLSMYGFTDTALFDIISAQLKNPSIFVQITLDSSQAGGVTEGKMLAPWLAGLTGNSIAVGRSERGGIVHLKEFVVDGIDVVTGSTNLSLSGEQQQANELLVIRNPLLAASVRTRLDIGHDTCLKQMAAQKAKTAA